MKAHRFYYLFICVFQIFCAKLSVQPLTQNRRRCLSGCSWSDEPSPQCLDPKGFHTGKDSLESQVRILPHVIVIHVCNQYHCSNAKRIFLRPRSHYADLQAENRFWYMPKYLFSGRLYPYYISGPGYVMSRAAAECILKGMWTLHAVCSYHHIEN